MNISEIISDALTYPLNNIKALLIYIILGIIAGIAGGATLIGMTTGATIRNAWALSGSAAIGLLILIVLGLLIQGYTLDIIKYGIERRSGGPGIEIVRQVTNAIKLIVVDIVYYIIPIIITAILGLFLRSWITTIISIILIIIFSLANVMARCRLAKSDSLGEALAVGEAIGDISKVGLVKLIGTVIILFIIAFIIIFILTFITNYNAIIGGILLGIFGVYFVFFTNRALGLLYSDA